MRRNQRLQIVGMHAPQHTSPGQRLLELQSDRKFGLIKPFGKLAHRNDVGRVVLQIVGFRFSAKQQGEPTRGASRRQHAYKRAQIKPMSGCEPFAQGSDHSGQERGIPAEKESLTRG